MSLLNCVGFWVSLFYKNKPYKNKKVEIGKTVTN